MPNPYLKILAIFPFKVSGLNGLTTKLETPACTTFKTFDASPSAVTIKKGVSFTYGTGSKELYLVTDPECPYCSKFAQAAKGQMDDYTVHVIFFPLSFHKNSPAMIEWIMQGKDDAEKKKRYDEIMLKRSTKYSILHKDETKPFFYSSEVQEKMDKSRQAALELNVRGTPMLFDADFNPLSMEQVIKVPKK